MDLTAIQAAFSSLKTATDISKTFVDIKSESEIQSKVISLQNALLDAQNCALSATAAQFEMQEKIRELATQLKNIANWEVQKNRYLLVNPWKGPAQAYALKHSFAENETAHLLCANCFHESKRVILNPERKDSWVFMTCPSCKAILDTGHARISYVGNPRFAEDYSKEN